MYIRGRNGTLKVEVFPLEEAIAKAKISPKRRSDPAKIKPLVSEARLRDSAKKRDKSYRPVGGMEPASALRSKNQSKTSLSPRSATNATTAAQKQKPIKPSKGKKRKPQKPTKKSPEFKSEFEGQPPFEGGIRIVQGGLPGLGRR